jgi:hypothetical protein
MFVLISLNLTIIKGQDKTVILTVSGQGKTQDEAKQNAFRSAIEQAFGTFISSKTDILNDNLVKDEIVSVANGNIQKFEVISEVLIPNGGYATTLKATVSVTKLTSFVESKGVAVEFKGGLLSANVKQQMLNEKNEQQAVSDILFILKELIDKSFDYNISSGTPKVIDGNNQNWNIPIIITVKTNKNFLNMYNYLNKTLTSLSLNESEVNDYNALNKETYLIYLEEPKRPLKAVYLRTQTSYEKIITELTTYFCKSMLSIKIEDNAGQYSFSPNLNLRDLNSSFLPINFISKYASKSSSANNIFEITQYLSDFIKDYAYQSIQRSNMPGNGYGYAFDNKISLLQYSGGKVIAIITINKNFTLEQINQLSGFKLTNN